MQPAPVLVPDPVLAREEGTREFLKPSLHGRAIVRVDLRPPPGGGRRNLILVVAEDLVQPSLPFNVAGRDVVLVNDAVHGFGGEPKPLPLGQPVRSLPLGVAAGDVQRLPKRGECEAHDEVGP